MKKHQSPPVLVKIVDPKEMREQEKDVKRQIRKNPDVISVVLARHNGVSCWSSLAFPDKPDPCVTLFGFPMCQRSHHRLQIKTLVMILVHESIHHTLEWLDGDPLDTESNKLSSSFDVMFPNVKDMKIFC